MEDLVKKLEQLKELIKAVRQLQVKSVGNSLPKIPTIKPPSMSPSVTPTKISSGQGPNSKKDPKKVAQQIKDGSMSTKTQKVMLKADSVTGQWYLEPSDPSSV